MVNSLPLPPELAGLVSPRKPGEIYHITIPQLPELRIEWHPLTLEMWVVPQKAGVAAVRAEKIADGVPNVNVSRNTALIWARGYMYGKERR